MLKDKIVKAHLSIIGANLFFGINYAIAKGVMPNFLKPNGFTLMRIATAFTLFFLLSLFLKKEKIQRSDYPRFLAAGFLGVAFNQFIFLTV